MSISIKSHHESQPKAKFYDGQCYESVRTEPYTRLNGRETTLLVWRSHCPTCGDAFEVRTPLRARKFEPNRRCPEHKRPGVKVNRRRVTGGVKS
jgi:hypothetical protein